MATLWKNLTRTKNTNSKVWSVLSVHITWSTCSKIGQAHHHGCNSMIQKCNTLPTGARCHHTWLNPKLHQLWSSMRNIPTVSHCQSTKSTGSSLCSSLKRSKCNTSELVNLNKVWPACLAMRASYKSKWNLWSNSKSSKKVIIATAMIRTCRAIKMIKTMM